VVKYLVGKHTLITALLGILILPLAFFIATGDTSTKKPIPTPQTSSTAPSEAKPEVKETVIKTETKPNKADAINWNSTVISAVATLVASFTGAGFAFLLANWSRKRQERTSSAKAGNRAMFMLWRQWNELRLFQTQIINPERNHPVRFITLLPNPETDYGDLRFDFDGLAFLLDTEYRECLMEVSVAENKFRRTVQLLDMRSQIRQEVAPLLEQAGIREGGEYTANAIIAVLGERRSGELVSITNDAIAHVDDTVTSIKTVGDRLHNALNKLYPKENIINWREGES
jgi:hypothetical protein